MFAKFSVKKPMTVFVAVMLVLILGFVSFTGMTPDLLPSMDFPVVLLMTSYPGASPEEVETTVTKPLEQVMSTLENITSVTSTSNENYSMLVLQFSDDVNMDSVTVDIREKTSSIEDYWPEMVSKPYMLKINPDMLPVMTAAVDMEGMNTIELTQFLNDTLMVKLEGVAGVASISASGTVEQTVNVFLSQEKIDSINDRMKQLTDEKFADAQRELDDGKRELQSGKNELQSGYETLQEELGRAESEVISGKAQLSAADMALEAAIDLADEQLPELKQQQKQFGELIRTLDQLEKAEKAFADQIAQIEQNDQLSDEQKEIMIAQIQSMPEYIAVVGGLAQIDAELANLGMTRQTIRTAYTALGESIYAIEDNLDYLEETKDELKEGSITLEDAIDEMNSKKAGAEWEIYNALVKISEGESALEMAQSQLDSAKEEAGKTNLGSTLTMDMISQILVAQNFSMPAGYIAEEDFDYLVRVGDKIENTKQLEDLMLFDPGIEGMDPIYLRDVADVLITDNAADTYAKMGKNDGIILSFNKQSSHATATVSENIRARFDLLCEQYEGLRFTSLMDQGDYIQIVVDSVLQNLVVGAILAAIILLFFLKDIKPTAIIVISIPISLVFAIVLMYFSGVTLNLISLSGLAVGVGMLVDNSVVVIENIYRLRAKGYTATQAAVSGTVQVGGAIVASTLTTVCVFLPIVFIEGFTRQLFTDMALTIAYSLLASLIVAMTVVPAVSQKMLQNHTEKSHKWFDKVLSLYEKAVQWALGKRILVLSLAAVLLVGSVVWAFGKGFSFMPSMSSSEISVSLQMPEDTTLEQTAATADEAIDRISKLDGVDTVGAMLSGGTMSMLGLGSGSSSGEQDVTSVSMYVLLKDDFSSSVQELAKEIEKVCADLDGEITASGDSDMSALMTAMSGSGVSLSLFGDDLDLLQQTAKDIALKIESVPGIAEVDSGVQDTTPEIRISVDKEKAMQNSLTVAQVYMEISKALKSETTSTTLRLEGNDVNVVIIDGKAADLTRTDLENHIITTTSMTGESKEVALRDIVSFIDAQSLNAIQRDSQRRYVTVSAQLEEGENVTLVSAEVQKALADYALPAGFSIEYTGESETIMESMTELGKMLLIAVAFIYLIMVAQFQSLLSPFIVLFTIPLAFTGGLLGLLLFGMDVSVISMIGFIMLAGIIVNNGIVLVDYINQLRLEGAPKREAIVEAGVTRIRPILMTTLTTVLGLLPMAIGSGMGAEIMQPIAIVCIFGLLYATLMTLFVVPVLYDVFARKEMHKVEEKELVLIED